MESPTLSPKEQGAPPQPASNDLSSTRKPCAVVFGSIVVYIITNVVYWIVSFVLSVSLFPGRVGEDFTVSETWAVINFFTFGAVVGVPAIIAFISIYSMLSMGRYSGQPFKSAWMALVLVQCLAVSISVVFTLLDYSVR